MEHSGAELDQLLQKSELYLNLVTYNIWCLKSEVKLGIILLETLKKGVKCLQRKEAASGK